MLTMRKAPTTSEMPAKISRNVVRNEIALSRSEADSSAASSPVTASRPSGQDAGHGVAQVLLGDAVGGGHPHVVVGVAAVEEEVLGGRGVERREGGAVERAAAGEPGDAHQRGRQPRGCGRRAPGRPAPGRPGRGRGDDRDPVAHGVPGPLGGALVEHHLVGAVRRVALDDRQSLEAVAGRCVGPVAADRRRAEPADHLAVGADDEDAHRADVAVDARRTRHLPQPVEQAGRDGRRWTAHPRRCAPPSGRTTTSPTVEAKSAVKLRLRVSEKISVPATNATPSTIANVLISRRTLRPSRLLRAALIMRSARAPARLRARSGARSGARPSGS